MSASATATQNTSNSTFVNSIYTARKILLELMEEQGYNVEDYSQFSFNELTAMFQNKQLDLLLEKKEEDPATKRKNKIYIRFYLGKVIRPNNIHEMIEDLFNIEEVLQKEDTFMIIIKDDMNETLMNELMHIWESENIFVVVQSLKRLQFNILKHTFVPKHTLMNSIEVSEMLTKYNITDKNLLPEISRFDPVAQAICLRPDQVCKIVRPSKTAIEAPYYRLCVNVAI
jgi:DNA-directed RNA polymerase subunit H (RpoH/RPB5)